MSRVYKETAKCVEKIVFDGKTYRRYPESSRSHLRRYFSCAGGYGFLHRAIYEKKYGQIPVGCHIHHIDGHHLNNSLENLECLQAKVHREHHRPEYSERGKSERQLAHLARIRIKTVAWHKSVEGRKWHIKHAKQIWVGRGREHKLECEQCGSKFDSFMPWARFCTVKCGNKNWYKNHPEYTAQKNARKAARIKALNTR